MESILKKGLIPKAGANMSPVDIGCGVTYNDYRASGETCLTYGVWKASVISSYKASKKIAKGVYMGIDPYVCCYMAGCMSKLRDAELTLLAIDDSKLSTDYISNDTDDTNGTSRVYAKVIPVDAISVVASGTLEAIKEQLKGEEHKTSHRCRRRSMTPSQRRWASLGLL